jgi:large conductance mechanosensitive channel
VTAAVIYFLVVMPVNKLLARLHPNTGAELNRSCPECLGSIPMAARRCAHCTSVLSPTATA